MDCTVYEVVYSYMIYNTVHKEYIKGVLKIYIVFMEIYVFEKLIFSYDFKGDFLCE